MKYCCNNITQPGVKAEALPPGNVYSNTLQHELRVAVCVLTFLVFSVSHDLQSDFCVSLVF